MAKNKNRAQDYGEISSRNLVKLGEQALVNQQKTTETNEDKNIFKYDITNSK